MIYKILLNSFLESSMKIIRNSYAASHRTLPGFLSKFFLELVKHFPGGLQEFFFISLAVCLKFSLRGFSVLSMYQSSFDFFRCSCREFCEMEFSKDFCRTVSRGLCRSISRGSSQRFARYASRASR